LFAQAGETSRVLPCAERAYRERLWSTIFDLQVNAIFDDFRSEPRFQAVLRNAGLPQ
jgi:hypothetical protein